MPTVPDYGLDLRCREDLDPLLRTESGADLMAGICFRRLYTPLGGLLSDPTALTLDVRDLVGQGIAGEHDLARIRAQCQSALLDDDRIFAAVVTSEYSYQTRVLVLTISGTGAYGPFALVLSVTALTVELLSPS